MRVEGAALRTLCAQVVYQLALLNRPKAPYLMTITKRDDV